MLSMFKQILEFLNGEFDSSMWNPNWFPGTGRVVSGKTTGIGRGWVH